MLRVISAPPGTGKTLLMVQQIYEYLNKGYQVYANITGLKIVGVLPAPYDWRDLPNDSVVFYDEAHEHPAFAKEHGLMQQENETLKDFKKRVAECLDIGNSLSVHRHFGFHIIMATQDPTQQLDSRLFGFFNEHIHMHRAFNASLATTYFWRKVQRNPDTKAVQNTCELKGTFKYPKHLYNFYESSSGEHNHKFKIPLKYIAFALIPVILFGKGVANAKETGFFGMFPKSDKQTEQPITQDQQPKDWKKYNEDLLNGTNTQNPNTADAQTSPVANETHTTEQIESQRISFISRSSSYCRAFDGNGNLMEIPLSDCQYLSDNPIALKAAPKQKRDQALQAASYHNDESGKFISSTEKQVF